MTYSVARIAMSETGTDGDVVLPFLFSSEDRDEASDVARRLRRAYGGTFGVLRPGEPTEYVGPEPKIDPSPTYGRMERKKKSYERLAAGIARDIFDRLETAEDDLVRLSPEELYDHLRQTERLLSALWDVARQVSPVAALVVSDSQQRTRAAIGRVQECWEEEGGEAT
jgi:hypothetical protein